MATDQHYRMWNYCSELFPYSSTIRFATLLYWNWNFCNETLIRRFEKFSPIRLLILILIAPAMQIKTTPDANTNHQGKTVAKADVEKPPEKVIVSCRLSEDNLSRYISKMRRCLILQKMIQCKWIIIQLKIVIDLGNGSITKEDESKSAESFS